MKPIPFTICWDKYVSAITTHGSVSQPFSPKFDTGNHPAFHEVSLLWDTGAVKTMISKRLVKQLGLIPIGMAHSFNTREMVEVEKFRVNLLLPNKIELTELETICDELPDTDILVGMDVINLCDVAITHKSGKTKFSFQIPSSADLDFEIV